VAAGVLDHAAHRVVQLVAGPERDGGAVRGGLRGPIGAGSQAVLGQKPLGQRRVQRKLPAIELDPEQLRPDDGNDVSSVDLGNQLVSEFLGVVHRRGSERDCIRIATRGQSRNRAQETAI